MEKGLYPLIILRYFADHSDEEHPVTPSEIQSHFIATLGVKPCSNTIRTIIIRLNNEGFEIIRLDGKPAKYVLKRHGLTSGEIIHLCDLIHSSFSISSDESNILINKLLEFLPKDLRNKYKEQIHKENLKKDSQSSGFFEKYSLLKRASSLHQTVSIVYRTNPILDHNEIVYKENTHILYPFAVTTNLSLAYLIAKKKGKPGVGHFRVDRIKSIKILSEPFTSDIPLEYYDHYEKYNSPYMYSGENVSASFICEMYILNAIADRIGFNPRFYQYEDDPDRFYLQFDAPKKDILLFAHQFSDGVILSNPTDLKDEMIQRLETSLTKYKSV